MRHSKINECIINRINVLKRKKPIHRKLQVLKNRAHLEYLEQFHQKYVIVPADKASSNIIVVCKKFYVDVMVNELQNIGQPSTYIASNYKYDQLVRKHLLDMQRWNIYVPPVMEQLPTMYWLYPSCIKPIWE